MARTHKQAVQAGVKFLDTHAPDWRAALRQSLVGQPMACGSGHVDIECGVCCILGRLLPGFWVSWRRLADDEDIREEKFARAVHLGFALAYGGRYRDRKRAREHLNTYWRQAI